MNEALVQKDFKRSNGSLVGLIAFWLSVTLILGGSHYIRVIVSETDSLPQHYFLHLPTWQPGLNEYTLLYSPWYGKKIIKQIIGVEADELWYDEDQCLWLNQRKIGKAKPRSQDNRALTPIPAQIIPQGFVFVYSEHPSSFDSRYQELGLVPLSKLEGRVIPLR